MLFFIFLSVVLLLLAAVTSAPVVTKMTAIGVPVFAAGLIITYLIVPPEIRSGGSYGSTRVALHEINFPARAPVTMGFRPKIDMVMLGNPDVGQAEPVQGANDNAPSARFPALVLGATETGVSLTVDRNMRRRIIVRVDDQQDHPLLMSGAIERDEFSACTTQFWQENKPLQMIKACIFGGLAVPRDLVCAHYGPDKDKRLWRMRPGKLYEEPGFGTKTAARAASCTSMAGRSIFRLTGNEHQLQSVEIGSAPIPIASGMRLRIYSLESSAGPADRELAPEPGQVRLAFDGKVSRQGTVLDGQIVLTLTRPDVRIYPAKATGPILLAGSDSLDKSTALLGTAAVFPRLGAVFEPMLSTIEIRLPNEVNTDVEQGQHGLARVSGDQMTVTGTASGARFSIRRIGFDAGPFARIGWLALAALAMGAVASVRLRWYSQPAAVLFGILELLLVVRLLIAVEGAVIDPAVATQIYPGNAILALLAAPAALLLAWRHWPPQVPGFSMAQWIVWALSGAIGAAAIYLLCDPRPSKESIVGALALITLGLLAKNWLAVWHWVAPRLHLDRLQLVSRGRYVQPCLFWVRDHLMLRPFVQVSALIRPYMSVVTLIVLIVVMRLILGGEMIDVGVRVAVSLLFVPLTLFAAALLFSPLASADAPSLNDRTPIVIFGALTAIGIGFASFAVSDTGFAILLWPVICGAFLVWTMRVDRRQAWIDIALAMAGATTSISLAVVWLNGWMSGPIATLAFTALILLPILWLIVSRRSRALWPLPALAVVVLALAIAIVARLPADSGTIELAAANDIGLNNARLLGALAPDRLTAAGTRAAQEFDGVLSVMRAYAENGTLIGAGFLNAPAPRTLIDTHLTDHAAAVHLFWPFGRVAAALLLMVPAAAALLSSRRIRPGDGVARWFGLLASFTLFLTTAYMMLANLGALPFTGRNMYLLAPRSTSDLVEGWMLIAIVALTFGRSDEA